MGRNRAGAELVSTSLGRRNDHEDSEPRSDDVPMRHSRRLPHGIYSVLGVAPYAAPCDVRTAYSEALATTEKAQLAAQTPQAKAAATKRMRLIQRHATYLFDQVDSSANRVRRHRASLSHAQRRLVSAKTAVRWSWEVKPQRQGKKHVPRAVSVEPPNGVRVRGNVVGVLTANRNNATASSYVIIKRGKKTLARDRRLKRITCVPGDIFVRRRQ